MSRAAMNRWNAKRDLNEKAIVDALEAVGCKVIRHKVYDLEVLYKPLQRRLMLDVKGSKGKLTKKQKALLDDGWPLKIARTVSEALWVCCEIDHEG